MTDKRESLNNEEFHIGKKIKDELARQGRNAPWLAGQVHCTPENIYKIFEQQWVGMPMLFKICRVMDFDFFAVCSEHLKAETIKQKVTENR